MTTASAPRYYRLVRTRCRSFALLLAASLTLQTMRAQQPMACHAMPAEVPALSPDKLPAPLAMTGIGNSHIAITTANPEAQRWFDQGLNLLHDFWDYESARAFEQSIRVDPNCAMCFWGLYQAESFRGEKDSWAHDAIKRADKLHKHTTPAEQLYIRAAVQEDKDGKKQRHKLAGGHPVDTASTKTLRKLVAQNPDDIQAKIFLSNSLNDGFDKEGKPKPGMVESRAILAAILAAHPDDSAANHYWIHAAEPGLQPEEALDSARKLGKLAPASGHMVHMPGHIFYRTGDYESARNSFAASMLTDEAYMRDQHVAVDDDWNYVHNLMYFVADLLEAGRIKEATLISEKLRTARGQRSATLYRWNPRDAVSRIHPQLPVALRSADWAGAIVLLHKTTLAPELKNITAMQSALLQYAIGMRALEQKKTTDAAEASRALDAAVKQLDADSKAETDKHDATSSPVHAFLNIAALELSASLLVQQDKLADAEKAFEKAALAEHNLGYHEPPNYIRPVQETRGDALLRAGRYADAKTAYQIALKERPNSGYPLFGIALATSHGDDTAATTVAYRAFLAAWERSADEDLPQMLVARAWLARNGPQSAQLR